MPRLLKIVAVAATVAMYLVLVMGSWVTNSGSAQGCGRSWPLCNGRWAPLADYHAMVEFGHRAVTGGATILVLLLAVWAWRALRADRSVPVLAVGAVLFLFVQASLGALAVIWPQPKAVLAAHFGISLLSFASVLLLAVRIFQADRGAPAPPAASAGLRRFVWYTAAFTYLAVYFGAYVRHIGATLACQGWPLCNGMLLPSLYGSVGASMLHRVAAALVLVLVLRLALLAQSHRAARPDLAIGGWWALVLAVAQAFSGALLATGHISVPYEMLHGAILSGFFGVLSYLCLQVLPLAPIRAAAYTG